MELEEAIYRFAALLYSLLNWVKPRKVYTLTVLVLSLLNQWHRKQPWVESAREDEHSQRWRVNIGKGKKVKVKEKK